MLGERNKQFYQAPLNENGKKDCFSNWCQQRHLPQNKKMSAQSQRTHQNVFTF